MSRWRLRLHLRYSRLGRVTSIEKEAGNSKKRFCFLSRYFSLSLSPFVVVRFPFFEVVSCSYFIFHFLYTCFRFLWNLAFQTTKLAIDWGFRIVNTFKFHCELSQLSTFRRRVQLLGDFFLKGSFQARVKDLFSKYWAKTSNVMIWLCLIKKITIFLGMISFSFFCSMFFFASNPFEIFW